MPAEGQGASRPEPNTLGLNPDWVASRLSRDGVIPVAELDSFIGTGQMSRNVRFGLRWEVPAIGPKSVVVKIPSADPPTRAVSFEHNLYRKECAFYEEILGLVDVTAPAPLVVHFDVDAQDFAIVLEDLSGSEQGDQFSEPTDEQLTLAVEQAARLQAPVWARTDASAFDALRVGEEQTAASRDMIPVFLQVVLQRLGPSLEPDVAALLNRFADHVMPWSELQNVPTTLVHRDFRPDNFMFGVAAEAPPLAVVDWQTVGLGAGVTDIAYLLAGSLSPERRRACEAAFLDRYRGELAARGVTLDAARCETEYALGSLHGVVIALTATVMAERTKRGDALFTLMLNRHGRHALDLGALDVLAKESS